MEEGVPSPPHSTDSEIEQESVMEIDISTAGASYTTQAGIKQWSDGELYWYWSHIEWYSWVILILIWYWMIFLNIYKCHLQQLVEALRGEEREGLPFSSSLPYDQFSNGNATPWEERSQLFIINWKANHWEVLFSNCQQFPALYNTRPEWESLGEVFSSSYLLIFISSPPNPAGK